MAVFFDFRGQESLSFYYSDCFSALSAGKVVNDPADIAEISTEYAEIESLCLCVQRERLFRFNKNIVS